MEAMVRKELLKSRDSAVPDGFSQRESVSVVDGVFLMRIDKYDPCGYGCGNGTQEMSMSRVFAKFMSTRKPKLI